MQKMVSYDYKKSFYISGHIPGTIRGGKSFHITFSNRTERLEIKTCTDRFAGTPKTSLW